MVIGVAKEIKSEEYRVALTPSGAASLKNEGHEVIVQASAGLGAGFSDEDYANAGCKIEGAAKELFGKSQLVLKVKEPMPEETKMLSEKHAIFTYLHLASSKELTQGLLDSKALCLAYETLKEKDGSLPLLVPMSEIAGRLSVQQGAKYLEKSSGGKGVLLSGGTGTEKGIVVIVGAGVVGVNAAKVAAGMGANVTLMDVNLQRLRHLEEVLPKNIHCVFSTDTTLKKYLKDCDLLIGAVLIPGRRAPKLITEKHLKAMEPGSVFVDVAIDQGGCAETSRPTTHKDPVYVESGIIHYCVANMPGAVPKTSTQALTQATLPYVSSLAKLNCEVERIKDDEVLKTAINLNQGEIWLDDILK